MSPTSYIYYTQFSIFRQSKKDSPAVSHSLSKQENGQSAFYNIISYSVTPCLKIAKSWNPAISAFTFLPEATSNTSWNNSFAASSSGRSSVTILPALKSIQLLLLPASLEFVAILTVGTGEANGVPRPVVNRTHLCAGSAQLSLLQGHYPVLLKRLSPFV